MTAELFQFLGHRVGKLTDQRAADVLDRACHGRLPVAKELSHEFFLLIAAIRRRDRYEIAQRGQKLNALLEQYDRHLRRTRARVLAWNRDDAEDKR
jgi:hypothetical protein